MFGLGMGEIIIIAIVALLALGPDKLPEAAKKIGETIRGLRQQTTQLRKTIEDDTQLGDAMREIRSALNEDPTKPAKPKPKAKPAAARRPAEGPPPDEPPPTEPLVRPAEDAVARGDDVAADVGASADLAPSAESSEGSNGSSIESSESAVSAESTEITESSETKATLTRRELSDYEKYIHNNGTEAAADKFGTSIEHAEAAMIASLERTTNG